MSINDKIKNEMEGRGWSVYQLSKRSKISKTAIINWFSPVPTTPNFDSIKKVAKAFNMPVEHLVSGKIDNDSQKQHLLELWNRLEKSEKDTIINVMSTILNHNK